MVICPICKVEVAALDKTGDAEGFDCPHHGKFRVSSTALTVKSAATREQWEAALQRARAWQPDAWVPIIHSYDF